MTPKRKPKPRPCTWTEDEDDGYWETSCDNMFEFFHGTPAENHFKFCPFCGRPIKERPVKGDRQ